MRLNKTECNHNCIEELINDHTKRVFTAFSQEDYVAIFWRCPSEEKCFTKYLVNPFRHVDLVTTI